jgi:hypothetical protein
VQTTKSIVSGGNPAAARVREERPMLVIELRDQRTVLRVARACVDDDTEVSGFDDKGVKAHQELAVVINEVGTSQVSGATSSRVASTKKSTGKDMTCSTTRVTRTPSTSQRYSRGRVGAVQTDAAVLA